MRIISITQEGVDLAIRNVAKAQPGLQSVKLSTQELRLYASPDYFKTIKRPKTPDDLFEHSWIKYSLRSRYFRNI